MRPLPRQQNRQTQALAQEFAKIGQDRTVAPFLDGAGQFIADVVAPPAARVKVPHLRRVVPRGFLVLNQRSTISAGSEATVFEEAGTRANDSLTLYNPGTDAITFDLWVY